MLRDNFKDLEMAAGMLKAVAHPVRLEIINTLKDRKKYSVGEIQAHLGITQSMTSQHLASLKNTGIVSRRKEANICYYTLANRNILKLLDCVQQCACTHRP